ncbi:cupin domain-containing protein [Streptomyces sp. P38-E01]|uniref:Cupin domain-containing protein n=1 Tax=Streptomyces tardus TaxID=2780544 RepID=A0A949N7L2_9ACTN|nr:cupin domain-containing protein [Streptomyces tardus]MBU7597561.1 cupin domain-containing protein [Streptomyces tardus]
MSDNTRAFAATWSAPVPESERLDIAAFYEHVWRRRPMVWRGCGADFLSPPLDWERVAEVERLPVRELGAAEARLSPDRTVLFVNQAQHAVPELDAACLALAEEFGWEECTADLSVTREQGAGIGCHFDHSDNFVVQQQGSKSWRVGLPSDTAPRRQRARMLEAKGFVPSGTLPPEVPQVRLEPGDVLYLPLFAPHEGVESASEEGSISVSFSCNARSALGSWMGPLMRRLSLEPEWWGPVPLDGPDPGRLSAALHRAFEDVLGQAGSRDGGDRAPVPTARPDTSPPPPAPTAD